MNRTNLLRVVVRVAAVVALGLVGVALVGATVSQPDDVSWLNGHLHAAVSGPVTGR